jgi:hypothetical protein
MTSAPMSPAVRYILNGGVSAEVKAAFLDTVRSDEYSEERESVRRAITPGGSVSIPISCSIIKLDELAEALRRNGKLTEGAEEALQVMKDYKEGEMGTGIPDADYKGLVDYFSGRGIHYTRAYHRENNGLSRLFYRKRHAAAVGALSQF